MSGWVKVTYKLRTHPKVAQVSDSAFRLYILSLCWCGEHLTDGAVPDYMLSSLAPGMRGKPQSAADELVNAGLWHVTSNGWEVHDYLDVQRSAAQVSEDREKSAQRMKESRAAKKAEQNGAWA